MTPAEAHQLVLEYLKSRGPESIGRDLFKFALRAPEQATAGGLTIRVNKPDIAALAAYDPLAHRAALEIATEALRAGKCPPQDIAKIAAEYTANGKSPRNRRHFIDNYWRNVHLSTAVSLLQENGYRPITRNDGSDHRASAIDIVVKAYAEANGCHLTYDAVRKIWDEHQ